MFKNLGTEPDPEECSIRSHGNISTDIFTNEDAR